MSLAREHRVLATATLAAVTSFALYSSGALAAAVDYMSSSSAFEPVRPSAKAVADSRCGREVAAGTSKVTVRSFEASWPITPDMCDASGRLYGGELLKLIDVMAGVASRKHSGSHTVTVSVECAVPGVSDSQP
jgi:acyl-CoA thioesterase 11